MLIPLISYSQSDVPEKYWITDSNFEDIINSHNAFGDDDINQFSSSLSDWTRAGTKVTWWQVRSNNKSNYHNIQNVTYKSINVSPPSNTYFTGSTIYYLPMKEF